MTDLARKGRPLVYGYLVLFLALGFFVVVVFYAGYSIGYEASLGRSCDGYLVGSFFSYECYDDSIVSVCYDASCGGVRYGEVLDIALD